MNAVWTIPFILLNVPRVLGGALLIGGVFLIAKF